MYFIDFLLALAQYSSLYFMYNSMLNQSPDEPPSALKKYLQAKNSKRGGESSPL